MRIGILGLGSIGLRHARNCKDLGHEVFGFDPDENRQLIFTSYGGISTTKESALACDRVVVASPTPNHWEDIQSLKCSALVEKPISDRPLDSIDLTNVQLVGYNLRYHSAVKQAKQWLNEGHIGRPLHANFVLAQFSGRPQYLRDGVILNWSHEIDLALHLLGKAEALATVCKSYTSATLFLHHQGGATSSVHLNYINKRELRYFDIVGENGRISCVLAPHRMADCVFDGSVFSYNYSTTFDEDYITEMKAFLSGDIGPGCTAEQGKDVLKICLGL